MPGVKPGKGQSTRGQLKGSVGKKKAAKPKTVKAQIRDLKRLLHKVGQAAYSPCTHVTSAHVCMHAYTLNAES